MVVNPDCSQLNRENAVFLTPFTPDNSVSRDRFGHQSRSSLLILDTLGKPDAYSLAISFLPVAATSSIHTVKHPRTSQDSPDLS